MLKLKVKKKKNKKKKNSERKRKLREWGRRKTRKEEKRPKKPFSCWEFEKALWGKWGEKKTVGDLNEEGGGKWWLGRISQFIARRKKS